MLNITLQQMMEELIQSIINKTPSEQYFYKREWEEGKPEYVEITEVDLMDTRYQTIDDDFSEYSWEMEKSNIYKYIEKGEKVDE